MNRISRIKHGYRIVESSDLKDTLQANSKTCVGMTANMIGGKKQIIVASLGFAPMILINPRIVKKSGKYETEEGCLSLTGVRKCTRYKDVNAGYLDMNMKSRSRTLADL